MPSIAAAVLALIVPPTCLSCHRPLGAAADLCGPCRRRLAWLGASCPACAQPRPCGRGCRGGRAAWDLVWAPLAHEGPARDLVLALKHGGRLPVARTMAAQMVASAPLALLDPAVTLVPVPADPWRARARGVDQAALLAGAVGARAGLPVSPCLRRAAAGRQVGRGRAGRLAAGRDLRLAAAAVPVRPVLVDDVHTTGATLDACARALRAQGAAWVGAISYTRALG